MCVFAFTFTCACAREEGRLCEHYPHTHAVVDEARLMFQVKLCQEEPVHGEVVQGADWSRLCTAALGPQPLQN